MPVLTRYYELFRLKYTNSKLKTLHHYFNTNRQIKIFPTEGAHDVLNICYQAKASLENLYNLKGSTYKSNAKYLRDRFVFIIEYIKFVYEMDDDMSFMRYPQNSDRVDNFFIGNDSTPIDLFGLYTWTKKIEFSCNEIKTFVELEMERIEAADEIFRDHAQNMHL